MNIKYAKRRMRKTRDPRLQLERGKVLARVQEWVGGQLERGTRWDHSWFLGADIDTALDEIRSMKAWTS